MDIEKYRMAKGGEKVGPCFADIKWNGFSFLLAAIIYQFSIGIPTSTEEDITIKLVLYIFLRNFIMMVTLFQSFHYFLYISPFKEHLVENGQKWNNAFPPNAQHQHDRNWTMLSLLINSCFEVYIWKYQTFQTTNINILYFMFWLILLPFWRELHFFITHHILHYKLFYKRFHARHHSAYNPGPWSGLTMHPVESSIYFTGTMLSYFLNLHPLHYLYANIHAQMASIYGHHGYDIYGGSYFHYLHHAKVTVNYGTPFLPLDILTNSWCTGEND